MMTDNNMHMLHEVAQQPEAYNSTCGVWLGVDMVLYDDGVWTGGRGRVSSLWEYPAIEGETGLSVQSENDCWN